MTDGIEGFERRKAHRKDLDLRERKELARLTKESRNKIREEGRCRNPHCVGRRKPQWHHIVPRSKFGKRDVVRHHPDNAVPLCHFCHMAWHGNEVVLHREDLSVSEVAFILEHAGKAFLDRHYPRRAA